MGRYIEISPIGQVNYVKLELLDIGRMSQFGKSNVQYLKLMKAMQAEDSKTPHTEAAVVAKKTPLNEVFFIQKKRLGFNGT